MGYLRLTLISGFIEAGDLCTADSLCHLFNASATKLMASGDDIRTHEFRVESTRLMGRIRGLQRRVDESEAIYLDVIAQNDRMYAMPNINSSGVMACHELGEMAESREDFVTAEEYYLLALAGALRELSVDNYEVLVHFQQLERILVAQHRTGRLGQLYQWAGHVPEYWEERIVEADPSKPQPVDVEYEIQASTKLNTARWKPPRTHSYNNIDSEILLECTLRPALPVSSDAEALYLNNIAFLKECGKLANAGNDD